MIEKCEEIVKQEYKNVNKIAVISGVGAREYYEKRGYKKENEYMIKDIANS